MKIKAHPLKSSVVIALGCLLAGGNDMHAQTIYASNFGDGTIESYSLEIGNSSASQFAGGADADGNAEGMAIYGGNLYVAGGNATIEEYPLAGGSPTEFASGEGGFYDLAISGGLLYAACGNNTIQEYPLAGGSPTQFASTSGLPGSLTISGGNLYASIIYSNTVEEYPLAGGSPTQFATTGLDWPEGLAVYNGNLYVANYQGNTIEEYSLADGNSSATLFANTGLAEPDAMKIYGQNLYVANYGNDTIEEFPLSGGSPTEFATTGLNGPVGLAISTTAVPEPSNLALILSACGILIIFKAAGNRKADKFERL